MVAYKVVLRLTEERKNRVIVLSEVPFQILLVGLLIAFVTVGSLLIPKLFKEKTKSKQNDHIVAILLSAFAVATYFSVSNVIPQAYLGDLFVNKNNVQEVEQGQARAFSLPLPLVINEYEQQPITVQAQDTDEEISVVIETTNYQDLVDFIRENESLIRADQSVDMVSYYQQNVSETIKQIIDEEPSGFDQDYLIEKLTERFPQHQFTYVEN